MKSRRVTSVDVAFLPDAPGVGGAPVIPSSGNEGYDYHVEVRLFPEESAYSYCACIAVGRDFVEVLDQLLFAYLEVVFGDRLTRL